ncbi:MAG: hypothetical protein FJ012_06060, partial [Chloroflexi bacterium]|nr:hypothetical protein [Chloroflexota bacterium]
MPVKALDLTGQKISKTEAAVFFIEPQDMVTQSEIAAPLELGGYPASGAAASADMAQIYPHQWYASWRSSTANMLIVTWKTREQAIAAPGEPSEKELLESWNRYYEEHWDELVAKYNGKYVAILEDT